MDDKNWLIRPFDRNLVRPSEISKRLYNFRDNTQDKPPRWLYHNPEDELEDPPDEEELLEGIVRDALEGGTDDGDDPFFYIDDPVLVGPEKPYGSSSEKKSSRDNKKPGRSLDDLYSKKNTSHDKKTDTDKEDDSLNYDYDNNEDDDDDEYDEESDGSSEESSSSHPDITESEAMRILDSFGEPSIKTFIREFMEHKDKPHILDAPLPRLPSRKSGGVYFYNYIEECCIKPDDVVKVVRSFEKLSIPDPLSFRNAYSISMIQTDVPSAKDTPRIAQYRIYLPEQEIGIPASASAYPLIKAIKQGFNLFGWKFMRNTADAEHQPEKTASSARRFSLGNGSSISFSLDASSDSLLVTFTAKTNFDYAKILSTINSFCTNLDTYVQSHLNS